MDEGVEAFVKKRDMECDNLDYFWRFKKEEMPQVVYL